MNWVPWTGAGLAIATNSISVLYGTYVTIFLARDILKRVSLFSAIAACSFLSSVVSLAANSFVMPWYGATFIIIGATCTAHVAGLVVVASLKPVALFAKKLTKDHTVAFERGVVYVVPGFLLISTSISMISGYVVNNTTGSRFGNDISVTVAMAAVFFFTGLASFIFIPFLIVFTGLLVNALDAAMGSDGKPQRGSVGINEIPDAAEIPKTKETQMNKLMVLRTRVQRLRIASTFSACAVVVLSVYGAGCQTIYSTVPFSWALYFSMVVALGLFTSQTSHFAKPTSEKQRNRNLGGGSSQSPSSTSNRKMGLDGRMQGVSTSGLAQGGSGTSGILSSGAGSGLLVPVIDQ